MNQSLCRDAASNAPNTAILDARPTTPNDGKVDEESLSPCTDLDVTISNSSESLRTPVDKQKPDQPERCYGLVHFRMTDSDNLSRGDADVSTVTGIVSISQHNIILSLS